MQFKKWIFTLPLALSLLTGCSLSEKLVYRIDLGQGNYVEQTAIDNLRFGMTKEQVKYVLGSPMLVEQGYPNTWYYIYHFTKGHNEPEQKNLIVRYSDSETLIKLEGDFKTHEAFFEPLN